MVEFGLKLEDNKVSKWKSHYMNYERLKKMLKLAKAAMIRRETLRKERRHRASKQESSARSHIVKNVDDSRSSSTASFTTGDSASVAAGRSTATMSKCGARKSSSVSNLLGSSSSPDARNGADAPTRSDVKASDKSLSNPSTGSKWTSRSILPSMSRETDDETTTLLPPPDKSPRGDSSYGVSGGMTSVASLSDMKRKLKSVLSSEELTSMARSLFDLGAKLNHQVAKAEADFELKQMEFSAVLKDECRRVEEFYCRKVEEYKTRLEVLEEAVYMSNTVESQESVSAGPTQSPHRRKYSMLEVRRVLQGKDVVDSERPELKNERVAADLATGSDDEEDDYTMDYSSGQQHAVQHKKMLASDSIKRAIVDLHRNVKLLENYCIMNYTGFVKIIKKHDKTIYDCKGSFSSLCAEKRFHDAREVNKLGNKMEQVYADWFCEGNLLQARAQMLPKVGDFLETDWSQLRFGYRLGMCAVLAVWVCWDCIFQVVVNGDKTIGATPAFPVFRACGGMLLLHWCWGISTLVWTRFRINYIYLFEFDPRNVKTSIGILNEAADETFVYLLCMLLYYKSCIGGLPLYFSSGCYSAFLVMYTIKCMIFPWRMRRGLWETVVNVVKSPLRYAWFRWQNLCPKVDDAWLIRLSPLPLPSLFRFRFVPSQFRPATFFSTYVADVITSMIKILQDWAWTFCYLLSGDFMVKDYKYLKHPKRHWQSYFEYTHVAIPLICLLPIWFRLMQCLRRYADTSKRWPNLANALKYGMSQTVTLFGTFHPLYLYQKGYVSRITEDDDTAKDDSIKSEMNLFQYFWICLFILSSLYSFCWDVWMDWGLGRRKHKFLGPRLMFPHQEWYYVAIFMDIFLRFLWVTSLVPPDSGAVFAFPNYLTALVMAAELFRRTVWGFFRLEQEHRANTEGYRRVDFVPLHFNTGHNHQVRGAQLDERHARGWRDFFLVSYFLLTSLLKIAYYRVFAVQRKRG